MTNSTQKDIAWRKPWTSKQRFREHKENSTESEKRRREFCAGKYVQDSPSETLVRTRYDGLSMFCAGSPGFSPGTFQRFRDIFCTGILARSISIGRMLYTGSYLYRCTVIEKRFQSGRETDSVRTAQCLACGPSRDPVNSALSQWV